MSKIKFEDCSHTCDKSGKYIIIRNMENLMIKIDESILIPKTNNVNVFKVSSFGHDGYFDDVYPINSSIECYIDGVFYTTHQYKKCENNENIVEFKIVKHDGNTSEIIYMKTYHNDINDNDECHNLWYGGFVSIVNNFISENNLNCYQVSQFL